MCLSTLSRSWHSIPDLLRQENIFGGVDVHRSQQAIPFLGFVDTNMIPHMYSSKWGFKEQSNTGMKEIQSALCDTSKIQYA